MNGKRLDHGACLSLLCGLLGRGGRVPEEDSRQGACRLLQTQNLLGFHFDRANGERERCLVPNSKFHFPDLWMFLEFRWARYRFCLTGGGLLDLSVSECGCLFMLTSTQGLHFPFCAIKSAKGDTQTMHGQAKSPSWAMTLCQPCFLASTWPWAVLCPPGCCSLQCKLTQSCVGRVGSSLLQILQSFWAG